jgi:hypothetical protein
MVLTRTRALTRQETSSDEEMETSPRIDNIPAITDRAHTEHEDNNIVALVQ